MAAQGAACLVLDNPRFKEVLLLAQIHNFRHPGEWVLCTRELLGQTHLGKAAIADKLQILFHHSCVHAQHTPGHGVPGVGDFQFCAFKDHLNHLLLKLAGPELGVFQFDLIDDVNTKVKVH